MSEIKLEAGVKAELVKKLQTYFEEELQQEIGSFEAEFLLDFIGKNFGGHYYNQGLADALKSFESKLEETAKMIHFLFMSVL